MNDIDPQSTDPQSPDPQSPDPQNPAGDPHRGHDREAFAAHPPKERSRPRRRLAVVGVAVASVLVLGGGGATAGALVTASVVRQAFSSASTGLSQSQLPQRSLRPGYGYGGTGQGSAGQGSTGQGSTGQTGSSSGTATPATAQQQVGVVTILTTLGYDAAAQAAGTGMVMTSNGLVLTNNHVIDGSTSIEVTVESTGETYAATVVGPDATDDVAVLQLADATGLSPVTFDQDDTTAVGDQVHSVGNAEGTGDLVTATGSVIGVDQAITVGNEYTGASESLAGLIEVDSDVVSGDSGGPLFDSEGDVIGIITAASSGSSDIVGYAIDIDAALAIVNQIESGTETATVQIGASPFLGVQLASGQGVATGGVPIAGVIAGLPAAAAGLVGGDTITSVDGVAVGSSDALSAIIAQHEAGDAVVIGWTDAAGAAHSATITLTAGPA